MSFNSNLIRIINVSSTTEKFENSIGDFILIYDIK